MTVTAINLVREDEPEQYSLYANPLKEEKLLRLDQTVFRIQKRFGKRAVRPATLLGDLKINASEMLVHSNGVVALAGGD